MIGRDPRASALRGRARSVRSAARPTRVPRRRSGIRRSWRPDPSGRAPSRSTTARWTGRRATGWRTASARAGSAASWPPLAWTWGSTSPPWTGCSRSGAPRGSPASCSAPGGAAIAPAPPAGSPACPPTPWSSSRWPPRGTGSRRARWSPGTPWSGPWTCWPSTWSPWRWERLPPRGAPPGSAHHPRLRRPPGGRVALGAGLRHPGRRGAAGLPRVRPRGGARRAAGGGEDREVARRHRMAVGTIVSDAHMTVQYLRGSSFDDEGRQTLGTA
jgi:hypothetical protein